MTFKNFEEEEEIKSKLREALQWYYTKNRGIGFTTASIQGVRNTNATLIVLNRAVADVLNKAEGNRNIAMGVQEFIINHMVMERPIILDNAVMQLLLEDLNGNK